MLLKDLDRYIKKILKMDEINDIALNGLQIGDDEKAINTVALCVDSNLNTIVKAANSKVDLIIAHHGLFWGKPFPFKGADYKKLEILVKNQIGLYAIHLPLDLHNPLGNNYQLALKLGLVNIKAFGDYHSIMIGVSGDYNGTLENLVSQCKLLSNTIKTIVHDSNKFNKIAIVSGNGGQDIFNDFIQSENNLFITGELEHVLYNTIIDWKLNVISLGHYESEKFGVIALGNILEKEFGLKTLFIEEPTGF